MLPLFPPPVNSCGTRARAWHALQARGGYGSGGAPKSSGSRGGRPRPHRISRPRTSAFSALHAGRFGFVAPACCFSHKRMHWHPRKPQGKTKRQGFSTVRRRRRLMRDAAPCAFALCANLAAPLRCAARRGEHTCVRARTSARGRRVLAECSLGLPSAGGPRRQHPGRRRRPPQSNVSGP